MKKFYKKTGRKLQFDAKEPVGFDKIKVECYNCHKTRHFDREYRSKGNQDSRRIDAWNTRNKDKDNGRRSGKQEESKALMTLDGEGVDWTGHLKDEQENYALMAYRSSSSYTEREQLDDANIEMQAYTQALKKVEAQLVAHQQNQLCQMRVRDKAGLGYRDQMNKGVLSFENEVFGSLFHSRSSDIKDSLVNDKYAEGMHQSKPSESDARSSDFNSCESNSSEETHESMPEPVVNEPKVETSTFAFINTIKHVKTPRQTVKEQNTCSQSPKPDKKDCSHLMSKKLGLGYGFTKKACFICGSFSHLIRDCDFHEKRMAKQAELNNRMCKGTGQRENRPVWNNVQRVNHQNQFVPIAVLTRTGRIQINTARTSGTNTVNTARYNFNSLAVPTNTARKVYTIRPIMNDVRPKTDFHKTHSPIRRPLNRRITPRTNVSNQKVNTAEVKAVSAVGGKRETAIKPLDYAQRALKNKGIIDSGCSRHMTGNKAYLAEYQDFNGGLVTFGAESAQNYFVLPIWSSYTSTVKSSEAKNEGEKYTKDTNLKTNEKPVYKEDQAFLDELERLKRQEKEANDAAEALRKEFAQDTEDLLLQVGTARASSTNTVNTASTQVSTVIPIDGLSYTDLTNLDQDDFQILALEDSYDNPNYGIFTNASYDDEGVVADFTNLETIVNVSPIPTSRIHSIHPSNQILGDPKSAVQIRRRVNKSSRAHAFLSYIQKQRRNNHKDFQHCLFACFLSQIEPTKISKALENESWVDAMQEELLQFKIQKVWILIDLPYGKKAIGTK
ncbi:hypothetical protein Tco_0153456 [Tanacetum coccineum]